MDELSKTDITNLLKLSYDKRMISYKNFKLDKSLSGQRVKVYYNDDLEKAIIVHRGTQGGQDIITDLKTVLGFDDSRRVEHAADIQRKAQKKYGDHIISLGHSLGAHLNTLVSPPDQSQINLNRPVMPSTTNKLKGKKQVDLYHQYDLVSLLRGSEIKNGKEIIIKDDSSPLNVLRNHSASALNRTLPQPHKGVAIGLPKPKPGIAIGLPKPRDLPDTTEAPSEIPPVPVQGSGLISKTKQNSWIAHIKRYQEEYKCSYKEAMSKAKESYSNRLKQV
jgi:hypothetical protein